MSVFGEALTYAQFLRGFRPFLREPLTLERAEAAIRGRIARREDALIEMARRFFYGLPTSPYRPLLDLAGCAEADFEAMVRDRGVEGTLRVLREAGVYFTFEEYKGREPVVRAGREIPVAEWQFDNPFLVHFYRSASGGSTGTPSRSPTGLDNLARQSELRMAFLAAHGILDQPFSIWRPTLPSGSGLNNVLRSARMGRPAVRWYTPLVPGEYRPAAKYSAATRAAVLTGRLCGSRFPFPRAVPLAEAGRIARRLAADVEQHGGAYVSTTVSCGLRIALAARAASLDLTGVSLFVAGEPATDAKIRGMRKSGARVLMDYGASEMGRVAFGCSDSDDPRDMHVASGSVALVLHPRVAPNSEETVHSLHVTSLVATTPKILLNMEFDDFGVLEERPCGCPLGALGMTRHLSDVRSFRKLVGEGVTLIGSDMVRILEHVLPDRFGGSSLSYQLVEDETDEGFTRLNLFVSPAVEIADERQVVRTVLEALGQSSVAADMARGYWESAHSFRVVRREPMVTTRGKQMPIRVVRSTDGRVGSLEP